MTAKRAAVAPPSPVVVTNTLSEIEQAKQRIKDLQQKAKADAAAAQEPLRKEYQAKLAELKASFRARGLRLAGAGTMSESGISAIAEGTKMFIAAGRPSRADLILVYGDKGPKMTWSQRAKAGIPAEKFPAGQLVATPGALAALEASGDSVFTYLQRHLAGDWGEVDEADRRENEFSLKAGLRIMSVYKLKTGVTVWIITESDRSSTCVLLPEEY